LQFNLNCTVDQLSIRLYMHQIRFPLGLRPRPGWVSLQRSPDPLAVFMGPTSKGARGKRERERRGKGRGEEGREGKRVDGKGKKGKGGKRGEWEHAPIGIFESRRLCCVLQGSVATQIR